MADEADDLRAGDGVEDGVITFYGEKFQLPERAGSMAKLRYAHLAEQEGLGEMEELAAVYGLLESVISDEDWQRFQRHAIKVRAELLELVEVVGWAMVALSGRPTVRSSASSDGPPLVEPSSTSTHAERAIGRLAGRPDLQNVVDMARNQQAS